MTLDGRKAEPWAGPAPPGACRGEHWPEGPSPGHSSGKPLCPGPLPPRPTSPCGCLPQPPLVHLAFRAADPSWSWRGPALGPESRPLHPELGSTVAWKGESSQKRLTFRRASSPLVHSQRLSTPTGERQKGLSEVCAPRTPTPPGPWAAAQEITGGAGRSGGLFSDNGWDIPEEGMDGGNSGKYLQWICPGARSSHLSPSGPVTRHPCTSFVHPPFTGAGLLTLSPGRFSPLPLPTEAAMLCWAGQPGPRALWPAAAGLREQPERKT